MLLNNTCLQNMFASSYDEEISIGRFEWIFQLIFSDLKRNKNEASTLLRYFRFRRSKIIVNFRFIQCLSVDVEYREENDVYRNLYSYKRLVKSW